MCFQHDEILPPYKTIYYLISELNPIILWSWIGLVTGFSSSCIKYVIVGISMTWSSHVKQLQIVLALKTLEQVENKHLFNFFMIETTPNWQLIMILNSQWMNSSISSSTCPGLNHKDCLLWGYLKHLFIIRKLSEQE